MAVLLLIPHHFDFAGRKGKEFRKAKGTSHLAQSTPYAVHWNGNYFKAAFFLCLHDE